MGSPTDPLKARLQAVQNDHANNLVCVDCGDPKPTWASLIVPPIGSPDGSPTLGGFCCFQCSGIHRSLGTHICFVRSVTLDEWKEKEILAMQHGGNDMVNQIFEAKRKESSNRLTAKANMSERKEFIRKKYVDRKYYAPSEYIMAIKKIQEMISEPSTQLFALKQSARDTQNKGGQRKRGNVGAADPFSRNEPIVSQVSVTKEAISDDDFFKSMSGDDDWIDPFGESTTAIATDPKQKSEKSRGGRKKQDGLSRSWHAQSPTKANTLKSVLDSNKFDQALQSRKSNPRRSASMMDNTKHKQYLEEDDTIFESVFTPPAVNKEISKAADSIATPRTVTNTSRRHARQMNDPLSTSCHASLSSKSRAKTIDLSKCLHGASKGASLFANRALPQSAKPANARPRLTRRMSMNNIAKDVQKPEPKAPNSDLVVEALMDFVKKNPELSIDAFKTALTPTDNKEGYDAKSNVKEASAADGNGRTNRASRARRTQRSSSNSRLDDRERSSSRARSNSRSHTNSRSRRANLIKRTSNGDLDGDGVNEASASRSSHRSTRRSRQRAPSDDQIEAKDPEKPSSSSSKDAEEVERSVPFGSSRRKSSSRSRERPSRSRSGNLSGRATRKSSSNHGSTPRRNGSSASGRTSSASGRRRQLRRTFSSDDVALEAEESNGNLPAGQDFEIEDLPAFDVEGKGVRPDSPTVSEASDILDDDDDLLIM